MKKICFIINSLESGGAERVVSILSNSFVDRFNITIITLKKSNNFYNILDKIMVKSPINIKNNFLMFLFLPFIFFKLYILKGKYLFLSFLELSNFLNIIINKDKAIISLRNSIKSYKEGSLKSRIYYFLMKILYPQSRCIIVNSRENKELADRYFKFNNEDKVKVIYNPIDLNDINLLKKEKVESDLLKFIENKTIFITIGSFTKQKNYQLMIESFMSIVGINNKNILLILGEGSEKNKIERLVNRLDLSDNILFLGNKKNIFKYLNISNYFIYSTRFEGFPNVLIEAMACDLPIITTDFKTGAREIIDPTLTFEEKLEYPYFGPNGVLLSLNNFSGNLLEVCQNLASLKQNKEGFSKFEILSVLKKWENIFNN